MMVSYSFQNMPNNIFCHNNNYHKSIMIVSIFNSQFWVPTYIEHSYSLVCMIPTYYKVEDNLKEL